MIQDRFKRKLSAIVSADIQGYSRLMEDDELGTIRTLKSSRRLISMLVSKFRGRVVDSPGDNMLAEFASAVDATECAISIQQALKIRNDDLPEDRQMRYRIGINLGEVIEDDGRLYGSGINIAARIEALAVGVLCCVIPTMKWFWKWQSMAGPMPSLRLIRATMVSVASFL